MVPNLLMFRGLQIGRIFTTEIRTLERGRSIKEFSLVTVPPSEGLWWADDMSSFVKGHKEGPMLNKMHNEFMPANSLVFNGKHHGIYLSDPRRVAPEKLKTILR